MENVVIALTSLLVISGIVHLVVWRKQRSRAQDASTPRIPYGHQATNTILDGLSLSSDQLLLLISNDASGRTFYDYALSHRAADSAVLELLAAQASTQELGKILAHPRSSEKAKRTVQERLRQEAERAAQEASASENTSTSEDSDDSYDSSCCGRGQGPYYH